MPRLAALLLLLLPLTVRADVTLAPLFTDHAVLQQGKPVPVWGHAAPGEPITVTFRDQTVQATAGKDGSWIVYLAPLHPGSPADLVVTGRNTLRLQDVVVGEVWVCSGQSNMEFRVWGPPGDVYRVDDADAEVAAATHPLIRQFKVERAVAAQPADTAQGSWVVCSPETVGQFTAVGYFFARDLAARLNVPIGIINSTWGGTAIESWLSEAALQSDPAFAVVGQRWAQALAEAPKLRAEREATLAQLAAGEAAARAAGPEKLAAFEKSRPWLPPLPGPDSPDAPGGLFNGMINPLLPGAIRGVLWYQGESNVGRPAEYGALFKALITYWRRHWGQGDFPFYFVQLPNYQDPGDPTGVAWARLREAQASALALPNTGMAVTIDVGDPHNIHPRNKQEVGRRLALIARHEVYDIAGDWCGPMFQAAVREGAAMRVTFAHAGSGLVARDKPLAGFVLAGIDRHFYPAAARIDGGTVVVTAPEVTYPVAVRYAWADAPDANLFDGAGLPAAPFRSDDW
jgi:sialate O-acetylesterase